MPVFLQDHFRVLYIHVPKTGGTSVEMFFEKNGFDAAFLDRGGRNSLTPVLKCAPQHMHAAQLREILHLPGFSYRFMTVRHPVTRLVSEYRMRAVVQAHIAPVDEWVAYVLDTYPRNPFMNDNHIRPQSEFWLPDCDVFRQEDGFGPAWAEQIAARIGCTFAVREVDVAMRFDAAPKVQPSADSMRRIRDFYARDFELFGYGI